MHCPICQTHVDGDSCSTCGHKVTSAAPVITRESIRRPKIPVDLSLVATIDRTGSSEPFKVGIPKTYRSIVQPVAAKVASLKCSVYTHGDEDEGQHPVLIADGCSHEEASSRVDTISYGGGGDPPEHHLSAVLNALQVTPWSSVRGSRGAIVLFATAESKPLRDGRSARDLGEEVNSRGVLLYLVCQRVPRLVELCDAAGGLMFEITNDPDPAELQKVAAMLSASIVASTASGSTVPMTVTV